MTPYEIEVCLWYHTRAHDWEGMDAPIWPSVRDNLMRLELLKESDFAFMAYEPTARLRAYVEVLINMPLPEHVWVIPVSSPQPSLTETETNEQEGG